MPEQEMGLAAQMGQQSGAPQAGSGGQMPTVEELAQLLLSGITPQQLVEAGVPQQLVEEAMAMVQAMSQTAAGPQGAMGQGGMPMDDQGLAAQAAMMGAM